MYTTAIAVRRMLPTLLIDEDLLGNVSSGTNIRLSVPALDVVSLTANGTDVEFTFVRPDRITLSVAATNQSFIALCYYGISDARLDELIEQADTIINTEFLYLQKPAETYLTTISTWIATSLYLKGYTTATDENTARADSYMKMASDTIKSLRVSVGTPVRSWVRKVNG